MKIRPRANIQIYLDFEEQLFEYIWLSKNLGMNIQIYLCWGNGTNTNTNNIQAPFH